MNVETANYIGAAFGVLERSDVNNISISNNDIISQGSARSSFGGVVGRLDDSVLDTVNSAGNYISSPNVERGEGGIFIGHLVKGQLSNAKSDADYFHFPVKTNHWRPAIASGFISDPRNPALQDVNIMGNYDELDWYNSNEYVHTINLTR